MDCDIIPRPFVKLSGQISRKPLFKTAPKRADIELDKFLPDQPILQKSLSHDFLQPFCYESTLI
jgi:hypothetical protein